MATNNSINSANPIGVVSGGTGAASLTAHGVLLGEGTSAIVALAAASTGQTLMGNSGGDPSFTGSPSFSGSVTAGTTVASTGDMTATTGNFVAIATSADANAQYLKLEKSRSGGVITSGDTLGNVVFYGHDGTGYIAGSQIVSVNSGTVATNRIASNLKFYTHPDSTSASTLRYTIDSAGQHTIAAPDSGTALTITGGGLTVTAGSTTLSALNSAGVVQTNSSGVLSTSNGTNGQVLIGGGSAPTWSTITGGTGISVSNAANSITISSTGGVSWNDQTGASVTMAVNNGYVMDRSSLITATLPASSAFGSTFEIVGKGSGGWKIAQNSGQTIHFGSSDTTTGTGGSLQSTNQYDSVRLVTITADTDFAVVSAQGNITVV